MLLRFIFSFTSFAALLCPSVIAHDVWLQTNTAVVRTGEWLHVDLRLGNHGNGHRDFKLAGRVSLDWVSVEHITPDGSKTDIRERMFATASAEKEGYWSAIVVPSRPGVHCIAESLDRVMQHGKSVRGIRTAKTYFLTADSLDAPRVAPHRHDQPLGMPFELVLKTCPFKQTKVGRPVEVQVLHHGQPISDVVVSMIPAGEQLVTDFDPRYERRSDDQGIVRFVPDSGNLYLIVAHHTAENEKSEDYEHTSYASTITLHVPNTAYLGDATR